MLGSIVGGGARMACVSSVVLRPDDVFTISTATLRKDIAETARTGIAYNRGEHVDNIGAVGTVLHVAENYSALAVSLAFPLFSDSGGMWGLLAGELDQLRSEFDRTPDVAAGIARRGALRLDGRRTARAGAQNNEQVAFPVGLSCAGEVEALTLADRPC
jgi:Bacterial transcriptional regulator